MKYKNIIVVGGSGLVGRSLQEIMPNATYLSSKDYDLTNRDGVETLFLERACDCLINLAAVVGGINANIKNPVKYLNDNVLMNTFLIDCAYKNKVKRVLSLISTCAYPNNLSENLYPLSEEFLLNGVPEKSNLGYAYAKRLLAIQTDTYNQQYGLKYQYLIPCNLYGEFDKYGDNSHLVASTIKKIFYAIKNGDDKIVMYGSGSPMRQFAYAPDLAHVIKHCIENNVYDNMNVAPTENFTVNAIVKIALKAMGAENLTIQYDPKYPDGIYRKDVSSQKLLSIIKNFKFTSLEDGIKQTYEKLLELKTFE